MKKRFLTAALALLLPAATMAQELRATWLTRTKFGSRAAIAQQMDSLASANFNTVYVNVWSRGYPLFQSARFFQQTGLRTDPTYADRDILAEAIAEGHRVGLRVEAWFEYGFVAGWTGNLAPGAVRGPILDVHPDWTATKLSGQQLDPASNFYWMAQSNPAAQNFLISLATEISRRYDVDGIQLDRIRYASLDYGYDPFTVVLYRQEHNGAAPPTAGNDAAWMRWRADKINSFHARVYDSIKAVNPRLIVSNAPSQYGSSTYTAYNQYLQDWKWWVDNNKVDNVQVQSYASTQAVYDGYITYAKNLVNDPTKVYPSFAVSPGSSVVLTNPQMVSYLDLARSKGFLGSAIWFADDLAGRFRYLSRTRFATPATAPFAAADWRTFRTLVPITDAANAVRSGTWLTSNNPGYSGPSLYADNTAGNALDYYLTVPADAWYEVYAYQVVSSNRNTAAPFQVTDATGTTTTVAVDQTRVSNAGFVKLGDFYLRTGRQRVVRLSADNTPAGRFVSADAVLLVRNRRLDGRAVPLGTRESRKATGSQLQAFPNPSQGTFSVRAETTLTAVRVTDQLGRVVYEQPVRLAAGATHAVQLRSALPAGQYVVQARQASGQWLSANVQLSR
ncbi:hypothetical protein E5K00_11665 [Hymenobacter aquaticus]|uniref:Uncharacterized protein n=1 Tax=Hymenobacter aquaticus TaxID=1867101 RepID=A0A4Z0Q9I3_9BACT|nr:family 10 glycosylhydrolase [Hymenobacter aquaticus]TGE25813.1 hypothetical protein E5K00_11665 [Hymenobacter aquaticus]